MDKVTETARQVITNIREKYGIRSDGSQDKEFSGLIILLYN